MSQPLLLPGSVGRDLNLPFNKSVALVDTAQPRHDPLSAANPRMIHLCGCKRGRWSCLSILPLVVLSEESTAERRHSVRLLII